MDKFQIAKDITIAAIPKLVYTRSGSTTEENNQIYAEQVASLYKTIFNTLTELEDDFTIAGLVE